MRICAQEAALAREISIFKSMMLCILKEARVRAAAVHPYAVRDAQPATRRAARSGINKFAEPTAQRRVGSADEVSGIVGNIANIAHSAWPVCFTFNLGYGRVARPRTYNRQSPAGEPENHLKFARSFGFDRHQRLTTFVLCAFSLKQCVKIGNRLVSGINVALQDLHFS